MLFRSINVLCFLRSSRQNYDRGSQHGHLKITFLREHGSIQGLWILSVHFRDVGGPASSVFPIERSWPSDRVLDTGHVVRAVRSCAVAAPVVSHARQGQNRLFLSHFLPRETAVRAWRSPLRRRVRASRSRRRWRVPAPRWPWREKGRLPSRPLLPFSSSPDLPPRPLLQTLAAAEDRKSVV